jgi:hypothetical protein
MPKPMTNAEYKDTCGKYKMLWSSLFLIEEIPGLTLLLETNYHGIGSCVYDLFNDTCQ